MRDNYLPWDDYFMSVGFLTSMRSKDPASQVGACIVNNKKIIVSIGYNGMPKGCSDELLPWSKQSSNKLENKYFYVCHAEMNAVLNKNSANLEGCTIYVALFPCNECAKLIIQSGIKEIVYYSDKHHDKLATIASKRLLNMAGIMCRQHRSSKISIPFDTNIHEDLNFRSLNLNHNNYNTEINENTNSGAIKVQRDQNKKRLDYIAWEEYFMALAFLSSLRSKDPISQEGACLVNKDNKVVGIGYNGMPKGCDDKLLPWNDTAKSRIETKYMYVCHAAMNAILNKNCHDVTEFALYVSSFPCNECAKFIIQAGIKEVIFYLEEDNDDEGIIAAKRMFDMVNVSYRKYKGKLNQICIDFETIDWNSSTQVPSSPIKPVL